MYNNPIQKAMKKLYSTKLFAYRCQLTPSNIVPTWQIVRNYYYRPVWRCEQEYPFDVTTCKDNELYSLRNTSINKKDEYFKSLVAEINKRQAVHPLLEAATEEEILDLETRTIKSAVTAQLKNKTLPHYYNELINDINLWRKKYGTT